MQFNEEQIALSKTVREFAIKEIHPHIEEWKNLECFLPIHCSKN